MKIACIKFAGLGSGGTEKYLQTLACILKKKYDVDYYYTNNAPRIGTSWKHPENSEERKKVMEQHSINLIPIHVEAYNEYNKTWIGSNFWEVFDQKKYDFVQTARFGFPEFPFTEIKGPQIIDSIHGSMSDPISNVTKSILLCKWQADMWIRNGGNSNKIDIIPTIVYVPEKKQSNIREKLNLPKDSFVYGFHQRNDDTIFSPISLVAFSIIQDKNSHFIILGGSDKHKEFVKQHNIKNVYFIDFTSNVEEIHNFIGSLDVYAHARSDGEICSAAIIEGMYHGLPVISHPAPSMGHAEQIENCGKMCSSIDDYALEMKKLREEKNYYEEKRIKTLNVYNTKYCYKTIENKLLNIYESLKS